MPQMEEIWIFPFVKKYDAISLRNDVNKRGDHPWWCFERVFHIIGVQKSDLCPFYLNGRVMRWTPFFNCERMIIYRKSDERKSLVNHKYTPQKCAHLFTPSALVVNIHPHVLPQKCWLMRWINKQQYAWDLFNGISTSRTHQSHRKYRVWFVQIWHDTFQHLFLFFPGKQHVPLSVWHFEIGKRRMQIKRPWCTNANGKVFAFFPLPSLSVTLLFFSFSFLLLPLKCTSLVTLVKSSLAFVIA